MFGETAAQPHAPALNRPEQKSVAQRIDSVIGAARVDLLRIACGVDGRCQFANQVRATVAENSQPRASPAVA